MQQILWSTALALGMAVVLLAWSQGKAAGPTVRPTSVPSTQAVIVRVTGIAEFRRAPEEPWKRCKADERLGMEVELRVGPRSAVVLEAGGRTVVLDRLGIHKVSQVMRLREPATTQGRRSFVSPEGGVVHESVIRSPTTTLIIRP